MVKLTIGMATYNDYHGCYFTLQSIRMHHKNVLYKIELVVLDNSPDSKHGNSVKKLCKDINAKYVPYTEKQSTSIRSEIFKHATGTHVLVLDCHVLLWENSLEKLIEYYENNFDSYDLYHGPLVYDDMNNLSTEMLGKWNDGFYGVWHTDKRGLDIDYPPYEINCHGLALFSCKKEAWLGFNPLFSEFGGEEGYIHEKYRLNGHKVYCLPFLRWLHRFDRPDGVPYKLSWDSRMYNYFIGWLELCLDVEEAKRHFYKKLNNKQLVDTIYKKARLDFDIYFNKED